jgi:protein transport protein SEC20
MIIQSYSSPVHDNTSQLSENEQDVEPPRVLRQIRQQQHQVSSLSEEDQQTVGASSNVTAALRRTHDLIASELSRGEFAHQTLTESSAALKQLNESYSSLDTMLASSKDLLGTLLRSQKSDTWYLQTAFYMLLATGAWLVFRRILYGPLWWLLWLPLRILFGVGTKAGSAVMSGRPGESGKEGAAAVGGGNGGVTVDGLPNEDLPTAKVGGKDGTETEEGDPDSMSEKVAKIVDEDARSKDEL